MSMIKRIAPLIFALYMPVQVLVAQTDTLPAENWDTYMAQYEKKAGSVLLNMSLKQVAPLRQYPYLVVTGVRFKDCPTGGFPSKREFNTLYKISDSVKSIVDRATPNIITGTFTFQCERLDYFYVKDTSWIRKWLNNMYQQRFPGYTPYINIKADTGWAAYLDFLYPNEETLDYMGNQKVLLALQRAGDKLERARTVDHWAYFKTDADRTCFINYALKNKFVITARDTIDDAGHPFSLYFSRTDKIDLPSISKITLELRRQVAKCNGDYSGWETVVVK
ncbi:MAG: DUF695 domain-containing protein [Chitinophagaceae bacterium]|nr:DUF695 domain-containing protein [Chitinophagaceae bacterium]